MHHIGRRPKVLRNPLRPRIFLLCSYASAFQLCAEFILGLAQDAAYEVEIPFMPWMEVAMIRTAEWPNRIKFVAEWFLASVRAKLGRCRRCWRLSLKWAALGWAASFAVYVIGSRTDLVPFLKVLWPSILVWPLGFTALWLLHMTVFGIRVAAWEWNGSRRTCDQNGVTKVTHDQEFSSDPKRETWAVATPTTARTQSLTRRSVIGLFATSVAFAVISSVHLGARTIDCEYADERYTCCDSPNAPVCWFCPNTQVYACCGSGLTHCCNNEGPWCCPGDCGGKRGDCRN